MTLHFLKVRHIYMLMSDNAARAVVKSSVGGIFDPENKQIGRVSEPCFTHERRFVAAFFF